MQREIYYNILANKFRFKKHRIDDMRTKHIFSCNLVTNTDNIMLHPNALYFIAVADLDKLVCFSNDISAVILGAKTIPSHLSFNCSLLMTTDDEGKFYNAYNNCMHALHTGYQMDSFIQSLEHDIAHGCSLQQIIDRVSDVYHYPISVLNNAYTILACTDYRKVEDPTLAAEYKNRYISPSGLDTLRKIRFLNPENITFHYRTYDLGENILYKRNIYSIIYAHDIPIGSIQVFDNNDIEEAKLIYLENIAHLISIRMQMDEVTSRNRGLQFGQMLATIIGDSGFESSLMEMRLNLLGYSIKKYRYIFAAKTTDAEAQISLKKLNSVGTFLANAISNSIFMVQNDQVILLNSRDKEATQEYFEELENAIANTNIVIGISNSFNDLGAGRNRLMEAQNVLEVGSMLDPGKVVYSFNDYQLSVFIKFIYHKRYFNALLYPPVLELIEYDKHSDAFLADTLKEYLKYPKDPKKVCANLFIHKNTLYYRLSKIRSIIKDDIDSADVITKITMTFKALEYKEAVEKISK